MEYINIHNINIVSFWNYFEFNFVMNGRLKIHEGCLCCTFSFSSIVNNSTWENMKHCIKWGKKATSSIALVLIIWHREYGGSTVVVLSSGCCSAAQRHSIEGTNVAYGRWGCMLTIRWKCWCVQTAAGHNLRDQRSPQRLLLPVQPPRDHVSSTCNGLFCPAIRIMLRGRGQSVVHRALPGVVGNE